MFPMRLVLMCVAAALAWGGNGQALGADKPGEVSQAVSKAVSADAKSSREASEWAGERASMLSEVSQLRARKAQLDHQVTKYRAYLKTQEEALARLDQKQEALARLNLELEPYLETAYLRLEEFIQGDLPFLEEERANRLAFLRRSLDDYHLELSEKLRRLMEALVVEAEYGNRVEKTQATLDLDGNPTLVDIFRLGRLGLYYLTPDGGRLGWLPRGTDKWQPLAPEYHRPLVRAVEMADRQRAVELITLPMGRPEK